MAARKMDSGWVKIQQKTFTKWVNMHLGKRGMKCEDIQEDLEDGKNLIVLCEILSAQSLGKYLKNPRMRIQKIQNVQQALGFIKDSGVRLVNMSAEDIVDKDLKLILGLIWTIIQKFAIADISLEELTAKEALLLWCQRKTEDYDNVSVKNFTRSFQDGLALCAIIHKHRPDLIDYASLKSENNAHNLELAFDVAEKNFNIHRLLDVEDMEVPDERSVITYVSQYYHYFASSRKQEVAARRVGNLIGLTKTMDQLKEEYALDAGKLKDWIKQKTDDMNDREFDNTLPGVESKCAAHNTYKSDEKPPKQAEKLEVEAKYNNIALKLRTNNRPVWTPPEGLSVADLNGDWDKLGEAETAREKALRDELARQQKIADLLKQFRVKAANLDNWHTGKEEYLKKKEDIDSLTAAQTQLKLLDAHDQEYEGSKARVEGLKCLGNQIVDLGATESDEVKAKMGSIDDKWAGLADLSGAKRNQLLAELELQQKMEALRKEFAQLAKEYTRWVKDTGEDIGNYKFGDSLEAVQAYESTMKEDDGTTNATSDEKKGEAQRVWDQLQELGVKDNRYTPLTMGDLENSEGQLHDSQKKRHDAYAAELKRQEDMEAKRKEFAAAAQAFVDWTAEDKAAIDAKEGEPEPLQDDIKAHHADGAAGAAKLNDLARIDAEASAMGIVDNKHTCESMPTLTSRNRQHNAHVANWLSALQEEYKIKQDFANHIQALIDWTTATVPKMEDRTFDNTLPGAQEAVRGFQTYKETEKAEKAADKAFVEELDASIRKQLAACDHKRPEFAPQVTLEDLEGHWTTLGTAEEGRREALDAELSRQERLADLASRFDQDSDDILAWASAKHDYLESSVESATLSEAQVQKTVLESFHGELSTKEESKSAIKALAEELRADNYNGMAAVDEKLQDIEGAWSDIGDKSKERDTRIQAEFDKFDAKCKEFAEKTEAFRAYMDGKRAEIDALEGEPGPLKEAIESAHQGGAEVKAKLAEVEDEDHKLTAMKITDNPHLKTTLADCRSLVRGLDTYVKDYVAELDDEAEVKDDYATRADALAQWIEERKGTLADRSNDNTLAGARAQVEALNEYRKSEKALKASDKSGIASFANKIEARLQASQHKRPDFAPERSVSDLDALWASLEEAEKEREEALRAEVKKQEELDARAKRFAKEADGIDAWVSTKAAYLKEEEEIASLTAAQVQQTRLASADEEHASHKARVEKLKDLSSGLASEGYNGADKVSERAAAVEASYEGLRDLSSAKGQTLSSAKEREVEKEDKRKAYAEAVKSMAEWTRCTLDKVQDAYFGSSLDEVKATKEKLDSEDAELTAASDEKKAAALALSADLTNLGVTENKHTSLTDSDVEEYSSTLASALASRREAYAAELHNQEEKDAKRKEYATAADAFIAYLAEQKAAVEAVEGEPEEKIAAVQGLYKEGADAQSRLGEVEQASSLSSPPNPYTENSLAVCTNSLGQFRNFVANFLSSLEEDKVLKERSIAQEAEWAKKDKLENMKIEYANGIQKLNLWLEQANDECTKTLRVTSVAEAEELKSALEAFEATKDESLVEGPAEMAAKLAEEEVSLVPSIEDVRAKWSEGLQQLEERKAAVAAEVERQQSNQSLCEAFGASADSLNSWISSFKQALEGSSGALEEQLKFFNDKSAELASDGAAKWTDLENADRAVNAAGISENKSTTHTLSSLKVEWDLLPNLVEEKKKVIEEEILKKKGSEVTSEQLAEFRESFNFFDKEKKGSLTPLQFQGVLNSLGVDADEAAVAKIFKDLDKEADGQLTFDEFTTFMSKHTQDTDTQDEIVASFSEIAGGKDFVTEQDLRALMSAEEVDYLLATMPKLELDTGVGYDYKAWAASAFSR